VFQLKTNKKSIADLAVVDAANYISKSSASVEAKKTATLLKTLSVNALVTGEEGVGKRTLASFILPTASCVDASNHDEILKLLQSAKEMVITNIEKSPNLVTLIKAIADNGVRVIATSQQTQTNEMIDELFSVKFYIPPLRERLEDVPVLVEKFADEARELFGGKKKFNSENFNPDLSQNANSLRRGVMIGYLLQDIEDKELMNIIQHYLYDRLGTSSDGDYRHFLYLYEVPLIRGGLKKFKSQLKLSEKLGLNRNTLRKKIEENKKYL
jgi:DNA-binding NtrC family response regulator